MHGHHRHFGRGRRGCGFPSREQLVERLQRYEQFLEREQENVQDLLSRLRDAEGETPAHEV